LEDIFDAGCNKVSRQGDGHCEMLGTPGKGVREVLLTSGPDSGATAAMGIKDGADAPTINTTGFLPKAVLRWLPMDKIASAGCRVPDGAM
jgi:hypothetical protein